jgi:hypothetical protein
VHAIAFNSINRVFGVYETALTQYIIDNLMHRGREFEVSIGTVCGLTPDEQFDRFAGVIEELDQRPICQGLLNVHCEFQVVSGNTTITPAGKKCPEAFLSQRVMVGEQVNQVMDTCKKPEFTLPAVE